jgi:hypothetical protein
MAGTNRGKWAPVVFLSMSIICHNVMWHGRAFLLEIEADHFLLISKSVSKIFQKYCLVTVSMETEGAFSFPGFQD